MVTSVLDRFNVYHLNLFWHTWRQETITIRCYKYNSWRFGTIGEFVLVLGSEVLLHLIAIPIIMLFICFVILCILFLSMVETLVIVSSGG